MEQTTIYESFSAEETRKLGQKFGAQAKPGEVYTLVGELGVGKTVLTQGIAEGLGIEESVCSPTFTIVQVYEEGRIPFYHFDVYRIGDIEEMVGPALFICSDLAGYITGQTIYIEGGRMID